MIAVEDLAVERGGVEVLADVSLAVEEGEFLALVGPNGAGKSTLLKAVGGILPAAAGRVTIDGRDVAGMSARETARLVASVPQDSSFDFDFTVREVVEMGRTPYRKRLRRNPDPDGPDRVAAALDRTDTAGFADRSVASLSGGEKQRVLLARALAQDAPALLLDEPTASLDINHQVRTLDLVAGLDETVVAAVHDLDLAARYCDRVALLAGGRLRAAGTPAEVFTADRLERVFGVGVAVGENPATGTASVTALSDGDAGERI
ncbi:ABC transporter ATP-binding protein [Halosegnis marinus]|uniref:Cobalamin import ATP-binding protein BtuD n=1 Tax=Halosegnis marinus TaxID=3034023 RepID=A0ABD5ZRQ6_9EURY|nr:ABC transporter ATP-binding protein [Halosegnis sp. DT85]